jgi:signal transduction histidine kinase
MTMSRAQWSGGRPELLVRGLAALTVLMAVTGVAWAGLDALELLPARVSHWGVEALRPGLPWLWGAAVCVLTSALLLARAEVLHAACRRSMNALLGQARHLGRLGEEPQTGSSAGSATADEVAAAMRSSGHDWEQRLAQQRAFSGQAAHQLRTPLTALGLQIEELTMHPEMPRQVRADLHRCRNEVDRLADIISDLLTLARRGALPPEQSQSDPAVVVVHATHRWVARARALGRRLCVTGPLPQCQVGAPAGPAGQVLDVLIDNALKHGVGDIDLSVAVVAGRVRLRVADQGDPMATAHGSTSGGEGIGLRLARTLASTCGGQLVQAQHHTTAFDLLLPLSGGGELVGTDPDPEVPHDALVPAPAPGDGPGRRTSGRRTSGRGGGDGLQQADDLAFEVGR